MTALVDVSLVAVWVWAGAWVVWRLLSAPRPPRHVWGELDSAHVMRAMRGRR